MAGSLPLSKKAAMSKELELTINIDGAARGNPGPAAFGYVIRHDGEAVMEENGLLGQATNNVAEYTALLRALARAKDLNASSVLIRSDSELLVKQMNGQYRVRNENLIPLHREAQQLARGFKSVGFSHVRREENRDADRLCNEALDGRGSGMQAPARGARQAGKAHRAEVPPLFPAPATDWPATQTEAERILREAGVAWAESGLDQPTPRQVLQRVVKLFQERGFMKPGHN
jgi:ribonuclease HI